MDIRDITTPVPNRDGSSNGVRPLDAAILLSEPGRVSRELSLVAKATDKFKIESTPEDEDDEADLLLSEDELSRTVPERPALPYAQLPTGVCYDSRMRFHIELDPPKDRSDYHPEDPRRILWIFRTLCEAGLVSKRDSELAVEPTVAQPLRMLPARLATRREVCTVHTEEHFLFLQDTASKSLAAPAFVC